MLSFIKIVGKNLPKVQNMTLFHHKSPGGLPDALKTRLDKYTPVTNTEGENIVLTDEMLKASFYYLSLKVT